LVYPGCRFSNTGVGHHPTIVNLENAIENSRHILLVLTPNWINSKWADFGELLAATGDPSGRRRRVLPLMLQKCELPPRIQFLTYADFTDSACRSEEMARLLKAMSVLAPVQDLFPANNERATHSAREGLMLLVELVKDPVVQQHVVRYRVIFEQTKEQIERLGKYKDLHDRLHDLQLRCYNPMLQELKRFPDGDDVQDNLRDHELTLESNVEQLQETIEKVSYLDNENSWIQQLDEVRQTLQEAIASADLEKLEHVAWVLKRVLSVQPMQVNMRLNEAARNMRLPQLVNAMTDLRDKIAGNNLEKTQLAQFEDGVNALDRLNCALEVMVKKHDDWQIVDWEIRRIEIELTAGLDELDRAWRYVRQLTDALCAKSLEAWVESFIQDTIQVQEAIAARDPAMIRTSFHRYCGRVRVRFYRIDDALLHLCSDLRQVGSPLDAVLRLVVS
jgi:hypothetical protein